MSYNLATRGFLNEFMDLLDNLNNNFNNDFFGRTVHSILPDDEWEENEDEFVRTINLGDGVDAKDVVVTFDEAENTVKVHYEKTEKNRTERYHLEETLPESVLPDTLEAFLNDGTVTLNVKKDKKAACDGVKKIKVKKA